jgi:hypothetical protein
MALVAEIRAAVTKTIAGSIASNRYTTSASAATAADLVLTTQNAVANSTGRNTMAAVADVAWADKHCCKSRNGRHRSMCSHRRASGLGGHSTFAFRGTGPHTPYTGPPIRPDSLFRRSRWDPYYRCSIQFRLRHRRNVSASAKIPIVPNENPPTLTGARAGIDPNNRRCRYCCGGKTCKRSKN